MIRNAYGDLVSSIKAELTNPQLQLFERLLQSGLVANHARSTRFRRWLGSKPQQLSESADRAECD